MWTRTHLHHHQHHHHHHHHQSHHLFTSKTVRYIEVHPPGKPTWHLKMDPFKWRILLETIILRVHVNFRGRKCESHDIRHTCKLYTHYASSIIMWILFLYHSKIFHLMDLCVYPPSFKVQVLAVDWASHHLRDPSPESKPAHHPPRVNDPISAARTANHAAGWYLASFMPRVQRRHSLREIFKQPPKPWR